MELSIIIVNWNAVDYIRDCIKSIYENTKDIKFEIIVVDNASTKGDVDSLKINYPDIIVIKSNDNLGFARANNLGFKQANGTYVLLLNPDTKLVGPAINKMFACIKEIPDAGIVGCRQVDPDLTVQTTSIQKFPTIINQIFNIEFLRLRWPSCPLWNIAPLFSDHTHPVKVDIIPGACMLLKSELFEQVGMFSEDYFMYAEDIDLNYKIAKTGVKNYYVSDAVIIHYGGVSSSQKAVSQWSTMMIYHAMDIYYRKNYGYIYAAMYRITMGVCALVRLALIGLGFPFGFILSKKQKLLFAGQKWTATLKWSIGLTKNIIKNH